MLDVFRKHTRIMMFFVFLLIIPSFVLFGIDGYQRMQNEDRVVAEVGGTDISHAQWEAAHRANAERLRAAHPEFDAKLLDSPFARYATLEELVRDKVLSAAVEKYRLVVSDARLAKTLHDDPTIASLRKPDGQIDMDRYRQLAAMHGMTPEGFEHGVRQDLSRRQIESTVRDSAFPVPALADLATQAYHEQRAVQVWNFPIATYLPKVQPTDAELQKEYDATPGAFLTEETVSIEYVVLDIEAIQKTIDVPEVDVRAYYDQHIDRYRSKEERRASHILIRADKDAAQRAQARARAEELLQTLRKAPTRFAELAKQHSQDPGSATKGGDLGHFGRGMMVKPFEDAVFALKVGELSDVVESDFGFHLIMLTDERQPVQRGLEEVRSTIETELRTQQAQQRFAEAAESFTNFVYEQPDTLQPAAEKWNLTVRTEQHLARRPHPAGGVLANQKFLDAIFAPDSIAKKHNTAAIELSPQQLVAGRVLAHAPARKQTIDEVRKQLLARVARNKAMALAQQEGDALAAKLRNKDPAVALPPEKLVSRQSFGDVPSQLVQAAMQAEAASLPVVQGVALGTTGYAVVRVARIVPADRSASAKEDREQYARAWSDAEGQAYSAVLRQVLGVRILEPKPGAAAGLTLP